jgi:hypothetical protein
VVVIVVVDNGLDYILNHCDWDGMWALYMRRARVRRIGGV